MVNGEMSQVSFVAFWHGGEGDSAGGVCGAFSDPARFLLGRLA